MIIQSRKVWIDGLFTPAQIEISEKKITNVYPYGARSVDEDYGEYRLIPGMIDVHCHGGMDYDTNEPDSEGLKRWMKALPLEGITSFCPTTVTQSEQVLTDALKNVASVKEEDADGAEILGVHFEGPYLNTKKKGAQPESFIVKPDVTQFQRYQEAAKGLIKIITMACERDEGFALTHYCHDHGVNVSLGHSSATYEEAVLAAQNGAVSTTHTFNGMPEMLHRNPSIPGAAMNLKDMYSEIICDGYHVDFPVVKAFVLAKGKDHVMMIDDALKAKGCKPGEYNFGGQLIVIEDTGIARIKGTDTIAGGTMKFNVGLRNLVEKVGLPMDWAINMTSLNPARYLRVDDRKGRIAYGYDADIVVIDDQYDVIQTYVRGRKCK